MKTVKTDAESRKNRAISRQSAVQSALLRLRKAPPEVAQRVYLELRNAGCTHAEVYALLRDNIANIRIDTVPVDR
jgi:hypothetical protein